MKSLFLAAAVLTASVAVAQTPQTPEPAPSFKAGVELVRLDVRVTDGNGRPVRDLKQSEIQVIEDGEQRPVLFFQHIEEPAASFSEIASHTVAGEVSTNQGAARGHLYVIFFDQQHILAGDEQRARRAAQRFIRTRLRPGDRVALFALPGPGPEIGFTSDVPHLIAGLEQVHGMADSEELGVLGTMTTYEAFQIVRGDDVVLQQVADRVQQQSIGSDTGNRIGQLLTAGTESTPLTDLVKEDARTIVDKADAQARRVLLMLSDVIAPMRAIEGRKTVLLISEGFFGDHLNRDVENVAAAAAQSYSVIYALDMNRRGLDPTAGAPTSGNNTVGVLDKINPLGSLAVETAGALVPEAWSHADQVFDQIADQSQDYYLVGFTPRDAALREAGRYRPIDVRVTRPGTRVSTRTGFALVDATKTLGRRQSIDQAFAAPYPQQGLPVQYTTYVLRGSGPGLQRVIVSLSADLPLASPQQTRPADVAFVVRAVGDGRIVASGSDVIALPERHVTGATAGTGTYRVNFELPAGDYLMRAVVREPGGLVGSADRRFTVRALDGPSIASGDLVLSSQRGELPVRPMAYTGDGLSGVVELYGRTADQLRDARVTVDLVPVGEHTAVVSGDADLQDIRTISGGAAREARLALPLKGIAPGAYVARARVTVGADTVADVVREVEVRGGERPAIAEETATAPFDPKEVAGAALARDVVAKLDRDAAPDAADVRRGLDRLAAADYPAAIAAFQAALTARPDRAATAFFLGWAYHGAGDDRDAISSWRGAAFADPTLVPAHLALADMYVRLAQPALAVQALRAGLTALPQSPELLDRLSRLEHHQ